MSEDRPRADGYGRALGRLREMLRTVGAIMRLDDEKTLLDFIAAAACEHLGYAACAVAIEDEDGRFKYRAATGVGADRVSELQAGSISAEKFDAIIATVSRSGGVCGLAADDPRLAPAGVAAIGDAGAPVVLVPLIGPDGERMGFLQPGLPSRPDGGLTPPAAEALLLETLGELAVIGLGIVRARAEEQAAAAVAEAQHVQIEALLESLMSASIRVRGSLALDEVLSEIAVALTRAGGFARCAIYLRDEGDKMNVRATYGLTDIEDAHLRAEAVTLDEISPLMNPAMLISRSFFFDHRYFDIPKELDAKLETPIEKPGWKPGDWHAEDTLTVPLTDPDGGLLGVISLDEPLDGRIPDRAHVHALEYFADQCAVAVTQARHYAAVRAQATTDELTGLANRRAFTESAVRTVARALADNEPCTLLFLDLDDFKRVNDTLGHAAGDEVLRLVAGVLSDRLRHHDLLARYGGEEFVALLANTDVGAAAELAETIRSRVAALSDDPVCRGLPVTVSIGVAGLSKEISTPDAMLVAADAALYEAKRAGRDRVRVFSS